MYTVLYTNTTTTTASISMVTITCAWRRASAPSQEASSSHCPPRPQWRWLSNPPLQGCKCCLAQSRTWVAHRNCALVHV